MHFLVCRRICYLPNTRQSTPGNSQSVCSLPTRTAQKVAQKSAAKHKATYDLKVHHFTLHEGNRVLVKNVGLRGKRKLADRWERTPYVIKSQPNPDIPVYEVQSENPRARKMRMLHRNLLLPFSSMGLPCDKSRTKDCPRCI